MGTGSFTAEAWSGFKKDYAIDSRTVSSDISGAAQNLILIPGILR